MTDRGLPARSSIPTMIVGLGNPGAAYVNTRHNLGQFIVDSFAQEDSLRWVTNRRLNADLSRGHAEGLNYILVRPLLMMNTSGYAVRRVADYFHIAPRNVIVVYDDINLPLATVKVTYRVGAGGHHGMEDICDKVGDCVRFRVGIGQKAPKEMDLKDYVLGKFSDEEQAAVLYSMPQIMRELREVLRALSRPQKG